MDEEAAREWLRSSFDVPRGTWDRLETFLAFLASENERQNLVSRQTMDQVWSRHVADSAQLICLAPPDAKAWVDLGTGAGFPGLIVALLHPTPLVMVEERRKRADFLRAAIGLLQLEGKARVCAERVERHKGGPYDVITARAFAPLPRLFEVASPLSDRRSLWILPKGRNAKSELEAAASSWQGDFRLEQSLTDPDASIIVARGVEAKRGTG